MLCTKILDGNISSLSLFPLGTCLWHSQQLLILQKSRVTHSGLHLTQCLHYIVIHVLFCVYRKNLTKIFDDRNAEAQNCQSKVSQYITSNILLLDIDYMYFVQLLLFADGNYSKQ